MPKSRLFFAGIALTIGLCAPSYAAGSSSDHLSAGEQLASEGNWSDALGEFKAAAAADGSNVVALYDLGVAYAHLKQYDNAADAERRAVAVNDQYVPAF